MTYEAFEYGKPAWERGGLSSRTISGESLAMCDPALAGDDGVSRAIIADVWVAFFRECQQYRCGQAALSLDAKLVPLYRKMCAYADEHINNNPPPPRLPAILTQHPAGASAGGGSNPFRR